MEQHAPPVRPLYGEWARPALLYRRDRRRHGGQLRHAQYRAARQHLYRQGRTPGAAQQPSGRSRARPVHLAARAAQPAKAREGRLMPENPRWKRRPSGSTWGDWGPDVQLGRLNLLTPDKVHKGIAEVKEGRTFCPSLPLDYPGGAVVNPRRHPPRLIANKRNGMPYIAYPLAREDPRLVDVVCDDIVEMTLQYSTQWDSLAHVGQLFDADGDGKPEIVFYNGYRAGEDIIGPMDYRDGGAVERGEHVGALRLSIDLMAAKGMQGRGVMIDLEHHCGRGESFVGYDQLMRIMDADKVEIEEGDLVCFRTGYDQVILGMSKSP